MLFFFPFSCIIVSIHRKEGNPMFIVLGGGLLVIIIAVIIAVISSVVSAVAADQDVED